MLSFPGHELQDEVSIWFERQPVDVARIVGLDFRRIDEAATGAATAAEIGSSFVAEIPGWEIHCEKSREHVIRVLRVIPARDAVACHAWLQ